jgi:hypothetical protein
MNEWRRVMASLADPVRRAVFAQLVLDEGTQVSAKQRVRALSELTEAGLVVDGRIDGALIRRLLGESPAAQGVERWVRDGRIVQWPARADDREELLRWAASTLPDGEHEEKPLTEALAQVTDDPVTLRRYLVDAEYLVRSPDGSVYRVPARP